MEEDSWGDQVYQNLFKLQGPEDGILLDNGSFGICVKWALAVDGADPEISRYSGMSIGSNGILTVESLVCTFSNNQSLKLTSFVGRKIHILNLFWGVIALNC